MSKPELTLIPHLTIHPGKLCIYNEIHWEPCRPAKTKMNMPIEYYESNYSRIKNSDRKSNGKISKNARRKMVKSIDYLLLMSNPNNSAQMPTGRTVRFCIAFITLTLPSKQIHDDNTIKKECLNQFLIELKTRHNIKNYVWRGEKQTNGNIHFHIIVDKFINWNELRNRWNRIINKLGYVDRYRLNQQAFHSTGFRFRPELAKNWSYDKQLNAYRTAAKHDFSNPNSTDVHSIKKIRNIKNYVCKYMTKNEDDPNNKQTIDNEHAIEIGRLWGCNRELSDIKGAQLIVDSEIQAAMADLVTKTKPKIFADTYFSVYYIDVKQLQEFSPHVLFKHFANYLVDRFGYHTQLSF